MRRQVITTESFETTRFETVNVVKKTPESLKAIETALKEHFLFASLPPSARKFCIDAMSNRSMLPGDVIIKQGSVGDEFFVVERGSVDVFVNNEKCTTLKAPCAFGELALMYNAPRAATITCASEGVLWVTQRMTFRKTLASQSMQDTFDRVEFLKKVAILKDLDKTQLNSLSGALMEQRFPKGSNIVTEGDKDGNNFYLIKSGNVAVIVKAKGQVNTLKGGEFFGEGSLLKNTPRNATCKAMEDVVCLTLDRANFNAILGPLDALKKVDAKRTAMNDATPAKEDDAPSSKSKDSKSGSSAPKSFLDPSIKLENLVAKRTIGTGTFGRVKLVQDKTNDKVYALKCLQKHHIKKSHQVKNVIAEKTAMASMSHPFVLKLYNTFQDKDQLYMALEIVYGGELWSLMYQSTALSRTTMGGFQENHARMYACIVLAGFEHIHKAGYAYRDLKPENLLIDKDGYVKIVDFGFAIKLAPGQKTQTLCGTPEYLSPELVLSKGHDRGVDFWAFGILIYEMLCGGTPFADEEHSRIFVKIVHSQRCLTFPGGLNRDVEHLIRRLLNPNPSLRLGMLRGGIEDIKKHRWFHGVNWMKLRKKLYRTPWVPKLKGPLDDSNIDDYDEDDKVVKFRGDQTEFADF